LVAANNAKLYQWNSPNWTQLGAYAGGDTSAQFQFAQSVDVLYFVDGTATLHSWDGAAITDLGGATNTDPPAAPGWIDSFTNRLILTKIPTVPDGVYFSNFLPSNAAGQWNRSTQQLRVGGGEGDPITGAKPWLDFNYIVFKKRSVWVINCDPTQSVSAFPIKPVHRLIGCLSPRTAAQVGSDVFFLATDGVRSVKRTIAAQTQTELSPNLSEPVQDIIDRINWTVANTFHGAFRDNKYLCWVALDGSTVPNYCMVYSALNQTWSGVWTGLTSTCTSLYVESGLTKLAIGNNAGNVYQWRDWVQAANEADSDFQDDGTNIAITAKTRAFDFGLIRAPKSGLDVEFEFYQSTANVTIQTIVDGASSQAFSTGSSSTGNQVIPIVIPFVLLRQGIQRLSYCVQGVGQFRELQFQITTTQQKLSMRGMELSAFQDSYVIQ
jgi:hypothetical protein